MDALTTPTTPIPSTPSREEVFTLTAQLVERAAADGVSPTAAALKTELMRACPGFSERNYGFNQFLKFLEEAQNAGHVMIERSASGHPRLSPPGGVRSALASPKQDSNRRLRPDLWAAIVNWEEPTSRYWDRRLRRAITLPLTADGAPLWEQDTERFAPIAPVSVELHLEWMRTFAAAQQDASVREELLESLRAKPEARAFKNALVRHGLTGAWGAELRTSVLEHAWRWAAEHDVPVNAFVEPIESRIVNDAERSRRNDSGATAARAESSIAAAQPAAASESAALRQRLHHVIDRMSLAELAALQIPAGYLIAE